MYHILLVSRVHYSRPRFNKSTQAGQLSNIPSPYGLCLGKVDAVRRGPNLNLIKKIGKGGGLPKQYARLCQMR